MGGSARRDGPTPDTHRQRPGVRVGQDGDPADVAALSLRLVRRGRGPVRPRVVRGGRRCARLRLRRVALRPRRPARPLRRDGRADAGQDLLEPDPQPHAPRGDAPARRGGVGPEADPGRTGPRPRLAEARAVVGRRLEVGRDDRVVSRPDGGRADPAVPDGVRPGVRPVDGPRRGRPPEGGGTRAPRRQRGRLADPARLSARDVRPGARHARSPAGPAALAGARAREPGSRPRPPARAGPEDRARPGFIEMGEPQRAAPAVDRALRPGPRRRGGRPPGVGLSARRTALGGLGPDRDDPPPPGRARAGREALVGGEDSPERGPPPGEGRRGPARGGGLRRGPDGIPRGDRGRPEAVRGPVRAGRPGGRRRPCPRRPDRGEGRGRGRAERHGEIGGGADRGMCGRSPTRRVSR